MSEPTPNRGREAEQRFEAICTSALRRGLFPEWVTGFEKSTKVEDMQGVDYWFRTADTDRLPIDIKCSRRAANSKRKQLRKSGTWKRQKRHYIRVILVTAERSDEAVLISTIRNLDIARRRWLKEYREKQQASLMRTLRRLSNIAQPGRSVPASP